MTQWYALDNLCLPLNVELVGVTVNMLQFPYTDALYYRFFLDACDRFIHIPCRRLIGTV